jgi:hypothetical protein
MTININGIDIIANPSLVIFYRKPRSKRRRIIKKWMKRPENWRPDTTIYVSGNKMVCHPEIYNKLKQSMAAKEKEDIQGCKRFWNTIEESASLSEDAIHKAFKAMGNHKDKTERIKELQQLFLHSAICFTHTPSNSKTKTYYDELLREHKAAVALQTKQAYIKPAYIKNYYDEK